MSRPSPAFRLSLTHPAHPPVLRADTAACTSEPACLLGAPRLCSSCWCMLCSGDCRLYLPPAPAAASLPRHSCRTFSRRDPPLGAVTTAAAAAAAPLPPGPTLSLLEWRRLFLAGEPMDPRSGMAGHSSSQASDTPCSICSCTSAGLMLAAPSRLAVTRPATKPRLAPDTACLHRSILPACSPATAADRAASAENPPAGAPPLLSVGPLVS